MMKKWVKKIWKKISDFITKGYEIIDVGGNWRI